MKIKAIITSIALAASTLVAQPSFASSVTNGKIIQMIPSANGMLVFVFSVNTSGGPSCASAWANRWVIDASSVAGQALAAVAITAFSSGSTVDIYGTSTCPTLLPSNEQVGYMVVYN